MAMTTYTHTRMAVVDESGNVNVLYPATTAADVSLSAAADTNIPSEVTNVQLLASRLSAAAFTEQINDSETSTDSTWSSSKIDEKFTELNSNSMNAIDSLEDKIISKIGDIEDNTPIFSLSDTTLNITYKERT